jgi:hypothetical protein
MSITLFWKQGMDLGSDAAGNQVIGRTVVFRAILSGQRRASWQGGMLWWYAGTDRATAVDSTPFSPAAIIQSLRRRALHRTGRHRAVGVGPGGLISYTFASTTGISVIELP